jgi:succinoglycan biosynthesis transport protein ExoP
MAATDDTLETGIPWLALLETVWRRRGLVLAIALAGSLATALWVWRTPALYRVHSTILLGAKPMAGPRTDAMSDKAIDSELALLESSTLIRDTLRAMAPPGAPAPRPTALASQVRRLSRDIETSRVEDSNVVEVAYSSDNPRWAARFINTLLAQHVERIARLDEQANTRTFFQGERSALYNRLQAAGDALNRFRSQEGDGLPVADDADLHKATAQLDADQATTESQHAEALARVAYLQQEIKRHPRQIAAESETRESDATRLLDTRLMQLEVQRSEAISKYTPTSSMVQSLESQIAATRRLLAGQKVEEAGQKTAVNPTYQTLEVELVQREAEAAALGARLTAVAAQRQQVRRQMDQVEAVTPQLTRLENDQKAANDAYLDYLHKAEEARVNREMDQSGLVNINILEPAEAPGIPESGRGPLKLLAGVAASLALAALAAAVRERLDPAVNSDAQAERIAGLPVIGSVAG